MDIDDRTYSRMVRGLKIVLPLLALAILSTLFLFARPIDAPTTLPFVNLDVTDMTRTQRIGSPEFKGVTPEGAAVSLTAEKATPDITTEGRIAGEVVRASLDLPTGERLDITAEEMDINYKSGLATLERGITISSTDGYVIRTESLTVAIDRTHASSDRSTVLTGPLGRINANGFTFSRAPNNPDAYVLVFKGDVKLLYTPKR